MAFTYRKLVEPEYGKVSPEVVIDVPQAMDFGNAEVWRTQCHLDTIADLVSLWKKCNCYPSLMSIKIKNIFISGIDGNKVPIRIYYPKTEGKHTVIIFYHGGGFMMNNPDVYDQVNRYLADFCDMLVIAPDYRLCPENKFPTGFNDCCSSYLWTKEHLEELNGTDIFVAGDSAGGNLATAVSIWARDQNQHGISGQILLYPTVSFLDLEPTKSEELYGTGHFLEYRSADKGLNDIYLSCEEDAFSPYTSPLHADSLENLPPACFINGECDPLLDQGLMYAARLEDAGNCVESHIYKGMIHAFINRPLHATIEAFQDMKDFTERIAKNK